MKTIQRLFCLLWAAILLSCTAAYAAPQPTDRFFVNDFANVLSPETENYIFETSKAYYESDRTQVVVTTVDSLDGKDIERYALDMARTWGIGAKDKNNGVLILLSVGDREVRVEVGTGLEGTLTDTEAGRFIRGAKPELSANDYDNGLKKIYTDVIGELQLPTPSQEEDDDGSIAGIILILFIIMLVLFSSFRRGGRGGGWHGGGFYGGFGGRGGFGGGGGFSGGGGGFSGGGGGFSGGGASGKF